MCAGRMILGNDIALEERTANVNRVRVERKANDGMIGHEGRTGTEGRFDHLVLQSRTSAAR